MTAAMDAMMTDALDTCWRLLVRGAGDRRSPVHTPVVATTGPDGRPDARIMVLRGADRASANLRFHTDMRSPKCRGIDGAPACINAYHPGEAVQLRISGVCRLDHDGARADAAWTASTPFGLRTYLTEAAPGTALPAPASGLPANIEGRAPTPDELVPARANFAVLLVTITRIDWLHLAQAGHRRLQLCCDDSRNWQGQWLVP